MASDTPDAGPVSSMLSIPACSEFPRHIAIVMDGNGRWARKRMLPRVAGHRRGLETVRRLVRQCLERGIPNLTLFAFSSENWRRPADEVSFLMKLFCVHCTPRCCACMPITSACG